MKSYVGIDVGSDSVKLIQLTKTRKGVALKRAGVYSLSEVPFYDGLLPADVAGEAIRWMLAQNDLKQTVAAVALPPEMVYTKFIKLPPVPLQKIDQIIRFEARQQIPFPLEDVCWDYQVLGAHQDSGEVHVAFYAVKDADINQFMQTLSRAGVELVFADVAPMALYNALLFNDHAPETVLVDIGFKQTQVVVGDDLGCWTRILPQGFSSWQKKLAEEGAISPEEAQEFAKNIGLNGEGGDAERSAVIREGLSTLLAEIRQTIDYYTSHHNSHYAMKRLVITGGASRLPGLTDLMAEQMDAEIELFDPFKRIQILPSVGEENVEGYRHQLALAVGLALRHIGQVKSEVNLLPKDILLDRSLRRKRLFIWTWGLLLCAFFFMNAFVLREKGSYLRQQVDKANETLAVFAKRKQSMERIYALVDPMQKQLDLLSAMSLDRFMVLDLLMALKNVTIYDMYYAQLKWGLEDSSLAKHKKKQAYDLHKTIFLSGETSDSYKKIDSLRIALASLPWFEQVVVTKAEESLDDRRKKIHFDMVLTLAERHRYE